MKTSHAKIGIGPLCMLFGKTRHAFYDKSWYTEIQLEAAHIALELVAQIRDEIPGIGTPKLYHMIKKPLETHGIKMGRDSLHKLLLENGLTIKRRRKYAITTDSKHWMKKYPNLIKEFEPIQSEEIWVADITYIIIKDDFNYLSLVTDFYSKKIMGHCLYPTLEAKGTLVALRMALAQRTKSIQLFHHSDRGTQYCSADYVNLLQSSGIEISMTDNGDPYENAVAERANGILKQDFNMGRVFNDREEALLTVEKSINAYNQLRPHMSCDLLTPDEAHKMTGPLKKRWNPKKYPETVTQTT
ncbi:MAG TPA: IS3 family transposase [Bacteroidia bacterium]|jgi:putative transposase|nr:IS3 family transposase [Bacteroidia bacterium]